jgi:hypothetical protein
MAAENDDGIRATRSQDQRLAPRRQKMMKCRWNDRTAAIVAALLTFANGSVSMITGVEGFLYGGEDLLQDSTVLVAIGAIIVFFAALVLFLVASRFEVRPPCEAV